MFGLQRWQVENTVKLIDEGNTIPFIARYRKEAHGTLDDQVLRELSEKLEYLRNLDKRREEISASITAQEKMTPEIEAALEKASTLAEIEDIYRPFRPKRRTRASIAKEKGLEPLADAIFAQVADSASPILLLKTYRMTQISAAVCARCSPLPVCFSRAPQTAKKRAFIRCIMSMTSRSIKLPVTACLPSTGARTKASSKSA